MTDELRAPANGNRGLGLRHEQERRQGERRAADRSIRDRRRSVRRRAKLRSLIFTAMALTIPHHLKHSQLKQSLERAAPEAHVSTSIDNVIAIPPSRAYERLI